MCFVYPECWGIEITLASTVSVFNKSVCNFCKFLFINPAMIFECKQISEAVKPLFFNINNITIEVHRTRENFIT